MGESKRRKAAQEAGEAAPVTCAYARGPALHLLMPHDDAVELEALDVADLVLAPNAMRPRGLAVFATDAADEALAGAMVARMRSEDRVCGFDIAGDLVRSFDTRDAPPDELQAMDMFTLSSAGAVPGELVRITSTHTGGLVRADGTPVTDIPAEMASLVRIDAEGRPLVGADAPLAMQYAVLSQALAGAMIAHASGLSGTRPGEAPPVMASIADHMAQLSTISAAVLDARPLDPGAWIDVGVLADAARAHPDGMPVDPEDVMADLGAAAEDGRPGSPRWRLAGMGNHLDWVARDEPGSGRIWTMRDGDFAKAFPDAPSAPGPSAEWIDLPVGSRAEVNAIMAPATPIARSGRHALARADGLGLYLCHLDDPGEPVLLAWPVSDASGPLSDPLMAEALAGADGWDDLPDPPDTPATRDVYASLHSTGLLAVLPEPDLQPDYAFLAIARAHHRGLGVPDLLASLAEVVARGGADAAFRTDLDPDDAPGADLVDDLLDEVDGPAADDGRYGSGLNPEEAAECDAVVASARILGGTPDPLLVAMFGGVDELDWMRVDLDRDVRLIRDACGLGCRLSDVALATLGVSLEGADDGRGHG